MAASVHRPRAKVLRSLTRRVLLFAAVWWGLTGGERSGIVVGAVAVLIAMIVSTRLSAPFEMRVSPVGLVALGWWFFIGSLRGGWDVAWRALSPRLPLGPHLIHYQPQLVSGAQRRIFTTLNTLMPGSLSIDSMSDDPDILIHVLVDRGDAFRHELETLDARVSGAFQVPPAIAEADDRDPRSST